ncbi:MAG: RnfABCDGE type electron transport complex subunit B [Bacteroidota bacterium]|nr:RnfABCDGE type electron transport complex subunit B [Bacteroidota bacterium]
MYSIIAYSFISMAGIGGLLAIVLYIVSQKFKVIEDPMIDEVVAILPQANCGGCGFAGCRALSEACVSRDDISQLYCPVGGNSVMAEIAELLGKTIPEKDPMVAVIRCNGHHSNRPRTNQYDGAASCKIKNTLYTGDTGCAHGCLGEGDCVKVCNFGAISINPETSLPVVDDNACAACGACVKACPRNVIELRKKSAKDRKIYVSCVNREKGTVARKSCTVACIGCGKCAKNCPHEAISIENNLAYIDSEKCKLCRKCVGECPTGAILEINFPVRKATPVTSENEVLAS